MTYQSPLHLLDSLGISPEELNADGISRLRKKLLAEFNLTNEITINLNNKFYTKDTILKQIDQLKEIDDLPVHKAIFERKMLLNWMENPQKYGLPIDDVKAILVQFKEINWLHQSIKKGIEFHINEAYKSKNFNSVIRSFSAVYVLSEQYQYEIWDELYTKITNTIQDIEQATQIPNTGNDRISFGFITNPAWTDLLNALPDTFQGLIDKYIAVGVNYTAAIERKDRDFAYEISYQLLQTNCSDYSLKELVEKNNKIFEKNAGTSSSNSGCSTWIIIIVLFNIIRMCASSGSSSSYSPSKYNTDKINNSRNFQMSSKTRYVMGMFIYKLRVRQSNQSGGEVINTKQGEDVTPNLTKGFGTLQSGEIPPVKLNPKEFTFHNESDYDMVIFRAGCLENRSYMVHAHTKFKLECCDEDKLFFYFGNKWLKTTYNKQIGDYQLDGVFAELHPNSIEFFRNQFTPHDVKENPIVIFDNQVLKESQSPKTQNVEFQRIQTN
jgi:hypothetical protein